MKNASQEYSGTYRCTSKNKVGTDECLVILHVVPRKYYTCCFAL